MVLVVRRLPIPAGGLVPLSPVSPTSKDRLSHGLGMKTGSTVNITLRINSKYSLNLITKVSELNQSLQCDTSEDDEATVTGDSSDNDNDVDDDDDDDDDGGDNNNKDADDNEDDKNKTVTMVVTMTMTMTKIRTTVAVTTTTMTAVMMVTATMTTTAVMNNYEAQ